MEDSDKKEPSEAEKIEAENVRLEAAIAKRKQLADETEVLRQRTMMAGKSVIVPPVPKREISPREYAQAALKGIILRE